MSQRHETRKSTVYIAMLATFAAGWANWAAGGKPPPPPAVSAGTTESVVPPVLVGSDDGKPAPPPVGPVIRPTPLPAGTVTFSGKIPPNARVTLPSLRIFGDGEIEIRGTANLRFSGAGTLWVDKASSVSLDPGTSGTRLSDSGMWKYDKFSGTARISGSSLRLLRATAKRIRVVGGGKGNITLRGLGTFRLTQSGGRLLSGIWDQAGVTKQFSSVGPATAGPWAESTTAKLGFPFGIVPPVPPPDARVYPPTKLPSEEGQRVAPPPGTPRTAPTTPTALPAPTPSQ